MFFVLEKAGGANKTFYYNRKFLEKIPGMYAVSEKAGVREQDLLGNVLRACAVWGKAGGGRKKLLGKISK